VSDETKYRTQGDLAREQLRRHGTPYFVDVAAEVRSRLERLPHDARRAFALVSAERAMAWHLRLHEAEQRSFTLGRRPVLEAIRTGLLDDADRAHERVGVALNAYHASAYDHSESQEGPDDADEDAAAAAIYAARCFQDASLDSTQRFRLVLVGLKATARARCQTESRAGTIPRGDVRVSRHPADGAVSVSPSKGR
jgi:hypothetical protein